MPAEAASRSKAMWKKKDGISLHQEYHVSRVTFGLFDEERFDSCLMSKYDVKWKQASSDLGSPGNLLRGRKTFGGKSQSTSVGKLRFTYHSNQDQKSVVKKSI